MVESRISRAIMQAAGVLLFASPAISPAIAQAMDSDSEGDLLFGRVYISLYVLAATAASLIIHRMRRRARNRHTGLPRPIKRRRARGPLKDKNLN